MRNNYQRLIFTILLMLLSFSGCATMPEGSYSDSADEQVPYAVARQLRYDDVPVPYNFYLIPSKSLSVENKSIRISSLHYKGRADRILVINFYKNNMPTYGWELINLIEGDQTVMNYSNSSEICTILMIGDTSDITLTISLSPEDKK